MGNRETLLRGYAAGLAAVAILMATSLSSPGTA